MPSSADAGGRFWAAIAASLVVASLCVQLAAPGVAARLDWQPALAWREPWRDWTAAWVHLSTLHLLANAAGAVLVGALGVVAHLPRRTAVAWLVAWPATQLGLLLLGPELDRYGGLSGVLHAGVAAAAVHLLVAARGTRRAIGGALLVALVAKVLSEDPAGAALRHPAGWDIPVVPFAHASGLVAGLLASALAEAFSRRPPTIRPDV